MSGAESCVLRVADLSLRETRSNPILATAARTWRLELTGGGLCAMRAFTPTAWTDVRRTTDRPSCPVLTNLPGARRSGDCFASLAMTVAAPTHERPGSVLMSTESSAPIWAS